MHFRPYPIQAQVMSQPGGGALTVDIAGSEQGSSFLETLSRNPLQPASLTTDKLTHPSVTKMAFSFSE